MTKENIIENFLEFQMEFYVIEKAQGDTPPYFLVQSNDLCLRKKHTNQISVLIYRDQLHPFKWAFTSFATQGILKDFDDYLFIPPSTAQLYIIEECVKIINNGLL